MYVTAEGNKLTDEISQNFDSCKYLMIVNMSDGSTNSIKTRTRRFVYSAFLISETHYYNHICTTHNIL